MHKEHLTKMQHCFMIKILSKPGIEGNFLNTMKGIHEKPMLTPYTSTVKDKAFPLRSVTRQDWLLSSLLSNIVLDTAIMQVKLKASKLERKKIKLSLFTDDMILHTESPRHPIPNKNKNENY